MTEAEEFRISSDIKEANNEVLRGRLEQAANLLQAVVDEHGELSCDLHEQIDIFLASQQGEQATAAENAGVHAEPAEGAQGELLPCPFCGGQANLTYDDYVHDDLRPMPVVECNACHTWVRAESWNKRSALAQPSPEDEQAEDQWRELALQFDRHRIQAMALIRAVAAGEAGQEDCAKFAALPPPAAQPSLAPELERPEVVAFLMKPDTYEPYVGLRRDGTCDCVEPLMTVAQHAGIIAKWADLLNRANDRADAAQARVAELEKEISDQDELVGFGCVGNVLADEIAQAGRVPEGYIVIQTASLSHVLGLVEGAMEDAYGNAFQVCCGKGRGGECCGDPEAGWSQEDQRTMDMLNPIQRELRAMLAAAPAQGGSTDE